MNRITINVDLDSNEVFQQEIRKALETEAKIIAREQVSSFIEKEVMRVVDGRIRDWTSENTHYKFKQRIKQLCDERVMSKITEMGLDSKTIHKELQERLDDVTKEAKYSFSQVERSMENIIDKRVADWMNTNFMRAFMKAMYNEEKSMKDGEK